MARVNNIMTGARGQIVARGKKVAWATGISIDRAYSKQGVEVLDSIEIVDIVNLGYSVSLRIDEIGVVGESAVSAGLLPARGQSSEEHLKNALAMEPMTVQVVDNGDSKKVLYEVHGVEFDRESMSLNARSMMMLNTSGIGKYVLDVAET